MHRLTELIILEANKSFSSSDGIKYNIVSHFKKHRYTHGLELKIRK